MTRTPALFPPSRKSTPGWDISALSTPEVNQWWSVIALPMVGMLLLLCCYLLQGVFAQLGPWAIFVAVKLITRRLEQKPPCDGRALGGSYASSLPWKQEFVYGTGEMR
ncbi:MAG TPA: hypothetical protein VKB35_04990 [Ktedonobacteraceae bacterium]|nr:hypothetical protein [Ktedonobacteraceae bacterium]